ncbi:hypothetical protein [Streptomyces wuyuanensis]|uniref:hypothetical protein n=1 Tax=Streptomyces wuyuanensis TaxID=1196353 RepID=UPI003D719BB7
MAHRQPAVRPSRRSARAASATWRPMAAACPLSSSPAAPSARTAVLAGVAMTRRRGRKGDGDDGNGAVRDEPAGVPERDEPAARPGGAISCR